jgi:hypothetical protein
MRFIRERLGIHFRVSERGFDEHPEDIWIDTATVLLILQHLDKDEYPTKEEEQEYLDD